MSDSLLVKWQKKFVKGDQYTDINCITNEICKIEKNYYFEYQRVFNIILPVIERWLKNYPNNSRRIWGKNGLVAQLIPYQKSYNDIKNKILYLVEFQTSPIMYVEDGSIDVDEISEEGLSPGKIIIYRQGSNRPYLENKNYKDDIEMLTILEEKCKKEFNDIANKLEQVFLAPSLPISLFTKVSG